MKIKIVTSKKIKNRFTKDAIKEYAKRLTRYCKIQLNVTNKIEKEIKNDSYLIKISNSGKMLTSEELADITSSLAISGNSHITFLFDDEHYVGNADFDLKISNMDIDNELLLIVLYEQIYRAYRIINNEPYHK